MQFGTSSSILVNLSPSHVWLIPFFYWLLLVILLFNKKMVVWCLLLRNRLVWYLTSMHQHYTIAFKEFAWVKDFRFPSNKKHKHFSGLVYNIQKAMWFWMFHFIRLDFLSFGTYVGPTVEVSFGTSIASYFLLFFLLLPFICFTLTIRCDLLGKHSHMDCC